VLYTVTPFVMETGGPASDFRKCIAVKDIEEGEDITYSYGVWLEYLPRVESQRILSLTCTSLARCAARCCGLHFISTGVDTTGCKG
jgi:hypothetical protein